MTLRFRTRIFLSAFAVAAISLAAVVFLLSRSYRQEVVASTIETLSAEARLVAREIGERGSVSPERLDADADRIGRDVTGRVTLIAHDGRVLGDSSAGGAELPRLENHRNRPEVLQALKEGLGTSVRHSATLGRDLVYVAVPVSGSPVAVVRLSRPLAIVREQAARATRFVMPALLVALAGALALAWISSRVLARRLDALAAVAREFASGNLTLRIHDLRNDELGSVARALDESVQQLGQRLLDLSRDRARMEAILAGMVEGVLAVNDRGEVELVNDAARAMLRLDASAVGRRYVELIRHPDIATELREALTGQVPRAVELSLGAEPTRTFVARAAPVASPGGAVLVLHDVSDLKRADRVRRDFVANVSHELRTPLTAIRGYVEALMDEPPPPDETRRFLEIIERHSWRMERLVKDLLRLARLDAGQETLERVPCQVETLLAGVLTEVQPAIESRSQTVRVEVAPDAAAVVADAAKLHDVLKNLVENASNYAPERSVITLQSLREGSSLCIRVLDQGPGIPESDLHRVFERFYRVDKARSRETGGTGLGLSIVRHLVELHGGEVRAANRPDGGAVFTVRLPAGTQGT